MMWAFHAATIILGTLPLMGQAFVPVRQRHAQRSSGSGSRIVASFTKLNIQMQTKFDKIKSFEARLDVIEKAAPTILEDFYEPHLMSFSVFPGATDQISITSTCYALQTLLSSIDSSMYDDVAIMDMRPFTEERAEEGFVESRAHVRSIVRELLTQHSNDEDLFQVPLLLYTILKADPNRYLLGPANMDEAIAAKVSDESILLYEAIL